MIQADGVVQTSEFARLRKGVQSTRRVPASVGPLALAVLSLTLFVAPTYAQSTGTSTGAQKPVAPARASAVSAAASESLPDGFRLPFAGDATWLTTSPEHTGPSADAIDFLPGAGTNSWDLDILAADEGVVIWEGVQANLPPLETYCAVNPSQTKGFGKLIILYHPRTGHQTYYAHLSSIASEVQTGAKVSKGQVIGVMGNSGCSSGPHLHFELRTGGGNSPFGGISTNVQSTRGIHTDGTATGPHQVVQVLLANGRDSCKLNTLAANDDGSTGSINLPFIINFFGGSYNHLFVNNNGNATFDSPLNTYTPFPILTTHTPIIAPFFADVDTRGSSSGLVTYGAGTFHGRTTFCADWVNVGYYNSSADKLNSFQLLLVDQSDRRTGDFDIYMNYDQIEWETGAASGGSGGLGGSSARVGYSNGRSSAGSFELQGSATAGTLLDSSLNGLTHQHRGNTSLPGQYIFEVQNSSNRVVDQTYSMQTGQHSSGNFLVNIISGVSQFLHLFVGPFHSDVDLRVTRPDGSVVSPSDVGVVYTKTGTYVELFVDSPAAGNWRYEVIANELDPGGEDIHVTADLATSIISTPTDATPPVTTASSTPPANAAGWQSANVTVGLRATDDVGGSGVQSVTYSAAGAQQIASTTVVGASAQVVIGTEGQTVLTFGAKDNAGNAELPKTLTIKLDKTTPIVTFSGNQGSYTVDKTVGISCAVSDPPGANGQPGSGIASSTCQNVSASAYTFPVGTTTLTARATDVASNVGTGSAAFTVRVTYASLCTLSRQFVSNGAMASGMCTVLDAARRNEQLGVPQGKAGELGGYRQMVEAAQRSGFVSAEHAAVLLRLVGTL